MLQQAIGKFDGISQIGIGNIHNIRFEYDKTLMGIRSPHVTVGNILLAMNRENKLIDCYFNLTEEIVCINSIGENILERLSGSDFDSDSLMLTDNEILICAAKRNYTIYKTPTSLVEAKKINRYYTAEQQADLDIKTSVNLIGEIVNLSQELNSLLWDKIYYGASYDNIKYLYYDICQLDVMSTIEIDSAKREFDIDNKKELDKIRRKYEQDLKREVVVIDEEGNEINTIKKKVPYFFAHVARQKGYYSPEKKDYCKYHTSMDYLQEIVNGFRVKTKYKRDTLPFSSILDNSKFRSGNINQKQVNRIYSITKKYINEQRLLFGTDIMLDEKRNQSEILKRELIENIDSETIGTSTMFTLLASLENENNRTIKNTLMKVLWLGGNESFKKNILATATDIDVITDNGNDIFLFDYGYKISKKLQIFS